MGLINTEQIIASRTAKGWDQKQLADAAGIDRSVISRLERGIQTDCRVSVLVAIANALNVAPELLIYRSPNSISQDTAPELVDAISRLTRHSPSAQKRAALILSAFTTGLEPDDPILEKK